MKSHVVLALLVVVLGINLANLLKPAVAAERPGELPSCASQVALQPHSDLLLGRHQEWLETPPHFAAGLSVWRLYPYVVVNTRTGLGYTWGLDQIDRAEEILRIAILTRWALLHLGWENDAWILLYDCSVPSDRT